MKIRICLVAGLIATLLATGCSANNDTSAGGGPMDVSTRDTGPSSEDSGAADTGVDVVDDTGGKVDTASDTTDGSSDTETAVDTRMNGDTADSGCDTSTGPTAVARVSDTQGGFGSSVTVPAFSYLELKGEQSSVPDGSIAEYKWSVLEKPTDSRAEIITEQSSENPSIFVDVVGTYRVGLEVVDDRGRRNCGGPAVVEITAEPNGGVHVQLRWSTPGDSDKTDSKGSDLNLHYLHEEQPDATWNDKPWDIHWQNKTADWGKKGDSSDNPRLDIDDTDGAGPENIIHDNAARGVYDVAVEYYDDSGFGKSHATVSVYMEGRLVQTYRKRNLEAGEVWQVARIVFPSGPIATLDKVTQGFPQR